jgi:sigma-B regulation protein RsbU (phosphoserine phosphatase)
MPSRDGHAEPRAIHPILESITDGILVADLDGRPVLMNSAAERILGVWRCAISRASWSEACGLFLPDRTTPYPVEDLPLARALCGETVIGAEIFVRNSRVPDGAWFSVNGTPWKNAEDVLQGGIVVFREITAHKLANEEAARLANAVEQTADSVVITNERGEISYVNRGFEQITGYSRAEVIGRTPALLKSGRHDAMFYRLMWAALLRGEVFQNTLVNRKKSGEVYHAEQTITPMKDAAGNVTHFVSVGKDVTELRKAQERETEMHLAAKVQRRLYPRSAPRVAGIDIAGAAQPSALTCGDYFDYIAMPQERLGIVVADVSGHGLGPALMMAETRALLRSCAQTHCDLGGILDRINEPLLEDLESNGFVTMLFASLDVRNRSLSYMNAGHPSGYILDRAGEIRVTLESSRVPLGVRTAIPGPEPEDVPLEPGDILVFLTDGIPESQTPDHEFFGIERVLAIVRDLRHEPARRILDELYRAVRAFQRGEPQIDDLTAVICKLEG